MTNINVKQNTKDNYQIGDFFDTPDGIMFLAQVSENMCCMISLEKGNRYRDHIKIMDQYTITDEDIVQMYGNEYAYISDITLVLGN